MSWKGKLCVCVKSEGWSSSFRRRNAKSSLGPQKFWQLFGRARVHRLRGAGKPSPIGRSAAVHPVPQPTQPRPVQRHRRLVINIERDDCLCVRYTIPRLQIETNSQTANYKLVIQLPATHNLGTTSPSSSTPDSPPCRKRPSAEPFSPPWIRAPGSSPQTT